MEGAIGFPNETASQTCYRRRWAFSAAGLTLSACMIFLGAILVLPFGSAYRTLGVVIMIAAACMALLCVTLPICAKVVKRESSSSSKQSHDKPPELDIATTDTEAPPDDFDTEKLAPDLERL